MTLTLYHQGHCGTLWPVINNVQLEHKIANIFFIYSKINAIMSTCLAIISDLDLSAPRSSLHLIVLIGIHLCVDSNILNSCDIT